MSAAPASMASVKRSRSPLVPQPQPPPFTPPEVPLLPVAEVEPELVPVAPLEFWLPPEEPLAVVAPVEPA